MKIENTMRISLAVAALLSFAAARRGGRRPIEFTGDCEVEEFPAEKGAFGACCIIDS